MAGFNVAPMAPLSPDLLAKLAAAGFHPPGAMSMGGGGGIPQAPGFNVGDGMVGLGAGLRALGGLKGSGVIDESGAVGPGGLAGAIAGVNALQPGADGVFAQPKMPTDIGYGQGGAGGGFLSGIMDPLTGLMTKLGLRP